jgi:hypothetical protein
MLVTQVTQERFLQVDVRYIIQYDDEDKAIFINCMDDIYSQASLAIINIAWSDVRKFFPGIVNRAPKKPKGRLILKKPLLYDDWVQRIPKAQTTGWATVCGQLEDGSSKKYSFLKGLLYLPRNRFIGSATWYEDARWGNANVIRGNSTYMARIRCYEKRSSFGLQDWRKGLVPELLLGRLEWYDILRGNIWISICCNLNF